MNTVTQAELFTARKRLKRLRNDGDPLFYECYADNVTDLSYRVVGAGKDPEEEYFKEIFLLPNPEHPFSSRLTKTRQSSRRSGTNSRFTATTMIRIMVQISLDSCRCLV